MSQALPMLFAIAGGVCLVLVLLALWQSLRALLAGGAEVDATRAAGTETRSALAQEKDVLLGALRELRFERELGKVSEADFAQLEQRYRGRARDVLRLLDEDLEPYRERARALIADSRQGSSKNVVEAPSAADAAHANTGACAACGTRNDADATFCKKCGGKLVAESSG
jgi:hypothetical protein